MKKLQAENPGTILMVEAGYKVYFYGEDAKVCDMPYGYVKLVDKNK